MTIRAAFTVCALVAALAATASASAGNVRFVEFAGHAEFKSEKSGVVSPGAVSIPTWSSSYVDGLTGGVFPYTMVGRSPMAGPSNTVVHTLLVPIDLTFAGGGVLRGSDKVAPTLASPIFQPAMFDGPKYATQYGNAIQKDMFWNTGGSNPSYNVTLQNDGVAAPLRLTVPRNQGYDVIGARTGIHYALADYAWLSKQLATYLQTVPPTVVPIFLTDNTYLWVQKESDCCLIGFHGATGSKAAVYTYIYATYSNEQLFEPLPGQKESFMGDIHGLSHEVSEWYADPFLTNDVVPWSSPTAPQYGCVGQLETGDPLVGYGWKLRMPNGVTYHPEDEAYLSWFAHETPSRAYRGRYTYLNTFSGTAPGC